MKKICKNNKIFKNWTYIYAITKITNFELKVKYFLKHKFLYNIIKNYNKNGFYIEK